MNYWLQFLPREIRLLRLALLLLALSPAGAGARVWKDFNAAKLEQIDEAITNTIAQKKTPGGVFWLEREGAIYRKSYGHRALVPKEEPASEDTIYDAASLTKVLATAPSVLLLLERGQLKLDDKVRAHLPEFRGEGTESMTLRHLITHTSGLRPGIGGAGWTGYTGAIATACT